MADITPNTAPIGGGKSLWGTNMVAHELEHSERFIVTDIPVIFENPPKDGGFLPTDNFHDWCQTWCKNPVNLHARLAVLSPEQATEFWRYLPAAYFGHITAEEFAKYGIEFEEYTWAHGTSRMIKLPNKPHPLFKEVPDFTFRTAIAANRKGCHYIIDEAHKKFPPMHYQRVGAQAEWYMSELRKLDDDLDWITQHPEKVDKNFRRNATQWMGFQNMGKTSLFMGVSFKGRFRWHWYNQPEMPTRTDKPTKSGWYTLDPKRRIHFLYKTMDGTGVSGGMLKESSMFKGRHWSIWVFAVLAIAAIAYILPRALQKGIEAGVGSVATGFQNGVQKGMQKMIPQAATNHPVPPQSYNLSPTGTGAPLTWLRGQRPGGPPLAAGGGLYCTGTALIGGDWVVCLSDGRVLHSANDEVSDVGKRAVKMPDGTIIPIR